MHAMKSTERVFPDAGDRAYGRNGVANKSSCPYVFVSTRGRENVRHLRREILCSVPRLLCNISLFAGKADQIVRSKRTRKRYALDSVYALRKEGKEQPKETVTPTQERMFQDWRESVPFAPKQLVRNRVQHDSSICSRFLTLSARCGVTPRSGGKRNEQKHRIFGERRGLRRDTEKICAERLCVQKHKSSTCSPYHTHTYDETSRLHARIAL
ncbi:UNVERIFIED_CONTAM: hypothetical protein HHA_226820 [Hammondia hammondi]|eukprot:XP_008882052.1 hypothetical protein HHA_226820 [Hammondia hammondi]